MVNPPVFTAPAPAGASWSAGLSLSLTLALMALRATCTLRQRSFQGRHGKRPPPDLIFGPDPACGVILLSALHRTKPLRLAACHAGRK